MILMKILLSNAEFFSFMAFTVNFIFRFDHPVLSIFPFSIFSLRWSRCVSRSGLLEWTCKYSTFQTAIWIHCLWNSMSLLTYYLFTPLTPTLPTFSSSPIPYRPPATLSSSHPPNLLSSSLPFSTLSSPISSEYPHSCEWETRGLLVQIPGRIVEKGRDIRHAPGT